MSGERIIIGEPSEVDGGAAAIYGSSHRADIGLETSLGGYLITNRDYEPAAQLQLTAEQALDVAEQIILDLLRHGRPTWRGHIAEWLVKTQRSNPIV